MWKEMMLYSAENLKLRGSSSKITKVFLFGSLLAILLLSGQQATAEDINSTDQAKLVQDSKAALATLYKEVAPSNIVAEKAHAILVFPSIKKAGLLIGGQFGNGVLFKGGKTQGYYNNSGASYGLQAGYQSFGYAMFLMNEPALEALNNAEGFEVGVGPSVVVIDDDTGAYAKNMTSTTLQDDVYAFIFNQEGLMAGLGIQGNKITKLED